MKKIGSHRVITNISEIRTHNNQITTNHYYEYDPNLGTWIKPNNFIDQLIKKIEGIEPTSAQTVSVELETYSSFFRTWSKCRNSIEDQIVALQSLDAALFKYLDSMFDPSIPLDESKYHMGICKILKQYTETSHQLL
jgi:hypothetical protein